MTLLSGSKPARHRYPQTRKSRRDDNRDHDAEDRGF